MKRIDQMIAALPPLLLAGTTGAAPLTSEEVAHCLERGVAVIVVEEPSKVLTAVGSGFLVAPDVVATNAHVVSGRAGIGVADAMGRNPIMSTAVLIDATYDLALIRLASPREGALALVDSLPRRGQRIHTMGAKKGRLGTYLDGSVSNIHRADTGLVDIAITAPVSFGSSGSPVVDDHCRVIGVVTFLTMDNIGVEDRFFYARSSQHLVPLLSAFLSDPLTGGGEAAPGRQSPTLPTPKSSSSELQIVLKDANDRLNAGDLDSALSRFQQAQSLDARSPEPALGVARVYIAKRKWYSAQMVLLLAAKAHPNDPRVFLLRGRLNQERGALRDAREDYRRYLELSPEGPEAETVKQHLIEIETEMAAENQPSAVPKR